MMDLEARLLAILVVSLLALVSSLALWAKIIRLERVASRQHRLLTLVARRLGLVTRAFTEIVAVSRAERKLRRLVKKPRKRYIAFLVMTETGPPPPPQAVEKAIIDAVEKLAGRLTVAEANIALVYYDHTRGAGVIRATHRTKYAVIAAMGMVRRINGKRVIIIPLRSSGTIKRAKKSIQQQR